MKIKIQNLKSVFFLIFEKSEDRTEFEIAWISAHVGQSSPLQSCAK